MQRGTASYQEGLLAVDPGGLARRTHRRPGYANGMRDFLITSLAASAVLTLALNFLPRLFPNSTRKVEQEVHRRVEEAWTDREPDDGGPRVKVFFPWKAMLIASIVLTVLVNVVAAIAA